MVERRWINSEFKMNILELENKKNKLKEKLDGSLSKRIRLYLIYEFAEELLSSKNGGFTYKLSAHKSDFPLFHSLFNFD